MRIRLVILLACTHGGVLTLTWLAAGQRGASLRTAGALTGPGGIPLPANFAIALVATCLVVLFTAMAIIRVVSGPIRRIAGLLERAATHRDYGARPKHEKATSITAPLVASVRHLLRQVEGEQRELSAVRERLERELCMRMSELSEREKAEQRIRHLAYHDALTDLPNRQLLCDRLATAIDDSEGTDEQLAVLYVDLDRFKSVNDTFGHGEGDELLRIVGERLTKCVRGKDLVTGPATSENHDANTVSRQGGDEFMILLTHMSGREEIGRVAARVIEVLAAPISLAGKQVVVGASVGVAVHPAHGRTATELLKHSDMAMYAAKAAGRNRCEFFSRSMKAAATRKSLLETDLRHALLYGELQVHYQPKVELASGRLVGLEALVRWLQPGGDTISPAEFVPLAEETGLVAELGQWVLRRVCKQAALWSAAGGPATPVAVNVSSIELRDRGFLDRVRTVLAETGLAPSLLELEITESAMIENPDDVIRTLKELRAVGVRVALDDFGTGYSSLVHVRRLPLDTIKLDASFVRGLPASQECRSIVAAVVGLAHSLDLTVVAEGVERPQQAACLDELGCDQLQGFLIAKALPPDEVEELLGACLLPRQEPVACPLPAPKSSSLQPVALGA